MVNNNNKVRTDRELIDVTLQTIVEIRSVPLGKMTYESENEIVERRQQQQ